MNTPESFPTWDGVMKKWLLFSPTLTRAAVRCDCNIKNRKANANRSKEQSSRQVIYCNSESAYKWPDRIL